MATKQVVPEQGKTRERLYGVHPPQPTDAPRSIPCGWSRSRPGASDRDAGSPDLNLNFPEDEERRYRVKRNQYGSKEGGAGFTDGVWGCSADVYVRVSVV